MKRVQGSIASGVDEVWGMNLVPEYDLGPRKQLDNMNRISSGGSRERERERGGEGGVRFRIRFWRVRRQLLPGPEGVIERRMRNFKKTVQVSLESRSIGARHTGSLARRGAPV